MRSNDLRSIFSDGISLNRDWRITLKNLFLDYLKNKLRLECEKFGLTLDSLINCDEPGHGRKVHRFAE
jgi:hypothetical protein